MLLTNLHCLQSHHHQIHNQIQIAQSVVWGSEFKCWSWLKLLAFWILEFMFVCVNNATLLLKGRCRGSWKPQTSACSFMLGFAFLSSGLPLSCRRTSWICQSWQGDFDQVCQSPTPKPSPAVQHCAPGLRSQSELWGNSLGVQEGILFRALHTASNPTCCFADLSCTVQAGRRREWRWKERCGSLFVLGLVGVFKDDLW